MADGSIARRDTFDRVADRYERARPDYPDALFDRLIDVSGLRPGDTILEIGCGPGKATLPLARRGFRITCVERGARLAAAARVALREFPDVEVCHDSFEEWTPRTRYDLVFAATAWHWIDPAVRYRRAADALRTRCGPADTWRTGRPPTYSPTRAIPC